MSHNWRWNPKIIDKLFTHNYWDYISYSFQKKTQHQLDEHLQQRHLWEQVEEPQPKFGEQEAVKDTTVPAEISESRAALQWGLISSTKSSDISISSNSLTHWDPWRSPICSVTGCSQGRDATLVGMFHCLIRQHHHSLLRCSVVLHKDKSESVLFIQCWNVN